LVTITSGALDQVIGSQGSDDTGNSDESDFHNRQGSIAWEKRTDATGALQAGATFEVTNGTTTINVVDNGANDADATGGVIKVNNLGPGVWTVTETAAPSGYALDDDATRLVTITTGALDQVIGSQGSDDTGNSDESDFHNRLGSIAWEKRTDATGALQTGATFEITNGTTTINVVDNGANDAD